MKIIQTTLLLLYLPICYVLVIIFGTLEWLSACIVNFVTGDGWISDWRIIK
jgi:hypothetical protein